jgi:hypothetical protein
MVPGQTLSFQWALFDFVKGHVRRLNAVYEGRRRWAMHLDDETAPAFTVAREL